MVFSLLIEAVYILIPTLYKSKPTIRILAYVFVFIALLECTVCWFLTWRDVANYVRKTFKGKYFSDASETPQGWRLCPSCQLDAPPRSHHCKLCGKCILKRDHHCFFTGSCIGFYNQRYFIVFCVHMIWSNLFALYMQLNYLNQVMPIFSSSFLNYIPAINIVFWMMGKIPLGLLLLTIHSYFCIFTLGASLFFLIWQVYLLSSGKTSFEAWKNINPYGKSALDNIRSVFGPLKLAWIMVFFPVPFELSEDGIKWEVTPQHLKKGH
ncbi:hypothetical protein LOTGIDRAFT_129679 [Lottia gigantea]|uniref:Palmitoyltransferase n=1 Tax=Lottia gigantea TaxID=225164 RepID=V3Z5Z7_LOTGI|nr:hypothetical protein LOTGIDRAFT_129679 [Lottia gigantea]ESO86203.1 hypothetical protein LOTGIDRAFT_129679 [Lottia gigantea]